MSKYGKSFDNQWKPSFERVPRCRKCGGNNIEIDMASNKRVCVNCKTDEYTGFVNYEDIKDNYQEDLNKVDERIPEGFPAPKL